MRITADTNILVRAIAEDDPVQARLAQTLLAEAELIALPLPVLCELVWVLAKGYAARGGEIASLLRRLIDSANVAVDRPAAEAGIRMLQAGGNFADGAIAFAGRALGAESFVSFDRKAVRLLAAAGVAARAPS